MDFALPEDVLELRERLRAFLAEHVLPREAELTRAIDDEVAPGVAYPAAIRELRARARAEGLWNLWLANHHEGPGLTNVAYGVLCEEMGRAMYVAPAIFNCSFPDTGNAEALLDYGTPEQVAQFARPLLDDDVRSCFALTEPDAASSDPTNISTSARLDGEEWVLDGHKWWISGATGASFAIVMAVTEPDAPQHARASMLLVPVDADGFEVVRALPLMGHARGYGHCELRFHGVRIPEQNVLGGRGEGFAVAQARLGPGRIHHCMRAIGGAERAFELMCRRANERVTRGEPLAGKQLVQDWVARSRIEIDTARLSVLHAAWTIDTVGKKAARQQIAQIKVQVAQMLCEVVDRAIQVHGALGLSDDTPLVSLYRMGRALRFGDGPDEVHKLTIARRELARFAPAVSQAPDLEAVRAALIEAGEPDMGELQARPIPGGASRDLWMLSAAGAPAPGWVLRRDPPGEAPQTSREAEFHVQRAAHAAGVPVPRAIAFEPAGGRLGTAGMLMEWVAGEAIPRRVLRHAPAGLARELGAALGALRGADTAALERFTQPPADPAAAALDVVRAELDAAGDALPALELGLRWLTLHPPSPATVGIVHGDFRLGNFLVAEEGLRALIDWEFWHLGDPLEDLAWVRARPWRFGADDHPVAGVGALDELLEGWGEPVDPARLRWWDVLSQAKWGAYCARQAALRRGGEHASLERTVLARRVAEAEWDMLTLIEGSGA